MNTDGPRLTRKITENPYSSVLVRVLFPNCRVDRKLNTEYFPSSAHYRLPPGAVSSIGLDEWRWWLYKLNEVASQKKQVSEFQVIDAKQVHRLEKHILPTFNNLHNPGRPLCRRRLKGIYDAQPFFGWRDYWPFYFGLRIHACKHWHIFDFV